MEPPDFNHGEGVRPPMINEIISGISLGNKKKLEELVTEELLEKLVHLIAEEEKEKKMSAILTFRQKS